MPQRRYCSGGRHAAVSGGTAARSIASCRWAVATAQPLLSSITNAACIRSSAVRRAKSMSSMYPRFPLMIGNVVPGSRLDHLVADDARSEISLSAMRREQASKRGVHLPAHRGVTDEERVTAVNAHELDAPSELGLDLVEPGFRGSAARG